MDIADTLAPRSDQLNADDLIGGPVTVTVERVEIRNSPEQPAHIHLVEFPGRPFKPSKTMRRLLAFSWGKSANGAYEGRKMTLFRNPTTKFGGDVVGGIEISHLSHLGKQVSVPLTSSKGKKSIHQVDPLPDAPKPIPDPTPDQITACTDPDTLRAWWAHSSPATRELINARGAALKDAEPTSA